MLKKFIAPLALTLALTVSASTASAGIGTGIGVSFPVGGSSSSSVSTSPRTAYAAFTFDNIAEELFVEEKRGALKMELKVSNSGDIEYTVPHNDGQVYEFVVLNKNGEILYRWSDGMAFTQALTSSSVAAHSFEVYKAEIERKVWKTIKDDAVLITAQIVDTPYTISTQLPNKTVITSSSSSPVTVHGGVVIGSGRW